MKMLKILAVGFVFFGLVSGVAFADHETTSTSAILSWDANTDDHTGYKVYTSTESGVYGAGIDVLNVVTFLVENLSVGTHFFVVTAYDAAGNESGFSEEVSKTVAVIPGDHTAPNVPTNLQIADEIALSIEHSTKALVMLIEKSETEVN